MNDDLRFDPIDDALRRRFAGPAPRDPDEVLDELRPRFRRARTRRRAALSGVATIAAVAVVAVSVAVGGAGGGRRSVRVPPATHGTAGPPPTVVTRVPQPALPTTGDQGVAGNSGTNGAETPQPTPPTATQDVSGSGPNADHPTAPSTPTTPPAVQQHSYSSAGGSIVVDFDGRAVSLASTSPAAGFGAEVHDNGPTRVEVRFSNGQTEWRIRVDVVNGALQPEVTQH